MTKLLFFPDPYPDEDFRSIIFRYHIISANETLKDTNLELFGKNSSKYPIFPTKLNTLFERLPFGHPYNMEMLIYQHTWIGLLYSFIGTEKRKDLMKVIKDGSENHFWISSLLPPNFFTSSIRYCPECLVEDYNAYGVCYARRKHQVSITNHCIKHRVKLLDRCTVCEEKLADLMNNCFVRTPHCKNGHNLYDKKVNGNIDFDLSEDLNREVFNLICLLNENANDLNKELIYNKILMGLWDKKLIHYKGRIMKKEMVHTLINKYGREKLNSIHIDVDQISNKSFLGRIFSGNYLTHIFFYCLVIYDLLGPAKQFLSYKVEIANSLPFGNGPWECKNKICEGHKRKTISRISRKAKNSGGVVVTAEFKCPLCGQIYVKRWQPNKEIKEKVMIKTMGYKWIKEVLNLYLEGEPVNKIAVKVGASEFGVARNLKRIFGQSNTLKNEYREAAIEIANTYLEMAPSNDFEEKRKKCRNQIIKTLKENPNLTRTDLYQKMFYVYQWLKTNDEKWLGENTPSIKRRGNNKIDLHEFDKTLTMKINGISKELYKSYPYQIKKHKILNCLSSVESSRLKSMRQRLPLSVDALQRNVEGVEGYLVRRLPYVVAQMRTMGWKTVNFNNIRSVYSLYKKCDLSTEKIIRKKLKEIKEN